MADVEGLTALQRRLAAISGPNIGRQMMTIVGMAAVREQKLLVHRKTGNLGRTIHLAEVTDDSALTVASASYAAYVERGTRPHVITPKVAKVLAWGGPRRLSGALRSGAKPTHFARLVHHPGTKPYPYMLPGAEKAVADAHLGDVVVKEWNGAA